MGRSHTRAFCRGLPLPSLATLRHCISPYGRYAYSVELSQLENDEEWQRAGLGEVAGTAAGGTVSAVPHGQRAGDNDDAEYGGALDDEGDPFMGSGALDTQMAVAKKQ